MYPSKSKVKIRYLATIIPVLYLTACNGGSSSGGSSSPAGQPYITITTTGLGVGESVAQGQNLIITASLTPNGNVVESQIISTLGGVIPSIESIVIYPTSTCSVSTVESNNLSCTINVGVGLYATTGSYQLTVQNQSSVKSGIDINESISFNVVNASYPSCVGESCILFFTGNHNANYGGIYGADGYCQIQSISTNPSVPPGVYKAFISVNPDRYACSTPNCIGGGNTSNDWVLHESTSYIYPNNIANL